MITEKQSPAGSAGQNEKPEGDTLLINSSKDSEFADNTQIEISIPEGTAIDRTPHLPTWGISHLEEYINHVSNVYKCPKDYVIFSVVSAIATASGKSATSYDGIYKNNPVIWGVLVGHQSMVKSDPLDEAFRPLSDIERESFEIYKEDLRNLKDGQTKPKRERILLADATPEEVDSILSYTKKGVCVMRDELASKFEEMGRYSNKSSISKELSLFSQKQYTVDRVSKDDLLIDKPFLCQIGTIQPDILVECMGSNKLRSNGYLARFLFAYADKQPYQKQRRISFDEKIIKRYNKFIRDIYYSEVISTYTISYTTEALSLLESFNDNMDIKASEAIDTYESGIYGKLKVHIQRWALAVYVARVFELSEGKKITSDIMRYSIECMKYFEYTALKVRALITSNRNTVTLDKGITKESVLQELVRLYPKAGENKKALADFIGVPRPQVSRALNKDPMLRCYGYGDSEAVSACEKEPSLSVTSINEAV